MKKILTLLLLYPLITGLAFGQAEKAIYKPVADNFEENYNAANYEAIFSSFSSEMQSALPLDKTKDFFFRTESTSGKNNQTGIY